MSKTQFQKEIAGITRSYKPSDETIEQRLTRLHNRLVEDRRGIDGNGLTEQGHAILFELRYALTGKCEHTMKIGKL